MSDRPSDDGGSARSDAASRLAALLADVVDDPAPPAPSPPDPGAVAPAPATRRLVRRRDLVEPVTTPEVEADPDATQPIRIIGAKTPKTAEPAEPAETAGSTPPAEPTVPIEDAVAARKRESEEQVLAEARAVVHAGAAPSPPATPLAKKPDSPWSRPAAVPVDVEPWPPAAAEPAPPEPPTPAAAPIAADSGSPGRRAPRLTLRAVAFGLALVLLMAAVPVLGWKGKDALLDSKGGRIVDTNQDRTEAGFIESVTPTQTGLVVHRDAAGLPVSASILSLGAGEKGGTVILVPLTLQPVEGSYFHTIIDGYDSAASDDGFRRSIEDVVGVSVPPPVINLTDQNLATLVAPVAPLALNVTDPVIADNGIPYEGAVSLAAEDVGPYMRATREGEPEIAHLERIRDVWDAWLTAIGDATATEPIGAAATGMGGFLRTLAAGDPVIETLEVDEQLDYLKGSSYVPAAGMNEQIIEAVPFPVSPREGRRPNIRLLNGAEGARPPMPLIRDLIVAGGSLAFLGNAGSFGQEDTVIEYKEASWKDEAEALQAALGEGVEIEQMSTRRADAEQEDMVITLGSDVLSRYEEQEDTGG